MAVAVSIENFMRSADNLYYRIGTELICFAVISVFLCIMHYMHPRKTQYYSYLQSGVFCTMLLAASDIILSFAAQYPSKAGYGMIIAMMSFNTLLYYTCLANTVLYIVFFLPDARKFAKNYEIAGRSISFAAWAAATTVYIIQGLKLNDFGIADLSTYAHAAVDVAFASCAFIVAFVLRHRRHISKAVFHGSLVFIPFEAMLLVIQITYLRSLFLSLIGILPLFCLYMFFHSNPYDEVLGCQNMYSLETRFAQNVKDKKKFYFITVRIPSLMHDAVSTEESEEVHVVIDMVRFLEQTYRDLNIYRRTAGEFFVIYEASYDEKSYTDVSMIKSVIREKLKSLDEAEKPVIMAMQYNEKVSDINMMTDIVQQAVEKYSDQSGLCDKTLRADEYDELIESYYLAELLKHLRDSNDYENENVVCYAQPIYEVGSGKFKTAESLMRLYVDGKMIQPDFFIPIAENNNCIHFLTVCMLHKVCAAVADLMKTSDFDAVSINVSVKEFSEANVSQEFLYIIRSYGVPVNKIRIELTESALASDSDMLEYNMQRLADAGIEFYLDDFGTGYSSFDRMTKLPFSVVKFDKSLLYSAMNDEKTDRLVSGMVPLLKNDHFTALIEGVEDTEQHDYSVGLGFEYVQGFQWAKPVPIDQLSEYFVKKAAPA